MANEIDALARTIWGEARGESISGQEAVASVIMNRVAFSKHRGRYWWGNTIVDVCQSPQQFSCWNKNDPNYSKLMKVGAEDIHFCMCRRIAERAVSGMLGDKTNGATHYHTRDCHPAWARGKIPCAEIGAHLFYNDIEK
ncbi:MAG: cell wall hydrolase [Alphaproteobacteria bacterium]|nr:cell wall hydrolase [Alphaproteobacteria bacterium]